LLLPFNPGMAPPPAAGPVVPVSTLVPALAVFDASAARGLFAHQQTLITHQVGLLQDGPAREAMARFNQWWDREMPRLCKRVQVHHLMLTGSYSHQTDHFQGQAFGQAGCLKIKPA